VSVVRHVKVRPARARRRTHPAVRALLVGAYVLCVEWVRVSIQAQPGLAIAALVIGGVALGAVALGTPADRLGLGTSRIAIRILGGLALGAVLLLPAAARSSAVPILPAGLAVAAIAVSIGEELAFRGALYAALDELGGAPLAIGGSTVVWTAAHALSHPPAFLGAVAAAGLLLALWRWACRDLVAPIIGHVIADLAL
jgi:membrane protease YdiL (CAAX protease family)